jgi:hypothetical protein
MQHEGAGEAALGPDRLAREIGSVLGAFARVESGSRTSLPRSGPLRTGRDDCSSSGSSLCRPVHRPRVVRMMAPSVYQLQVVQLVCSVVAARCDVVCVDEG